MKVFIVGKQASGKLDVLNMLETLGVSVGREFSNCPKLYPQMYIDPKYEKYTIDDIEKIFENKSYICIGGIDEQSVIDAYTYYRGISFYTYDRADVMMLQPVQLLNLNKKLITDEVLFVWLDATRDQRIHKHCKDHRTYNFKEIEDLESQYDSDFVKVLYNFPNSNVIYFNNEIPERIATIITAILKHPDLKEMFVENFN